MTFTEKHVEDSAVQLQQLMNPEHANPFGNVHGGVIMKLADEAAAICAMRHANRPCVTVAMDSMTFRSPVQVGDLISLAANVNWVGRTSMEVGVKVTAENPIEGRVTHTNSAYLVFVALGGDGKPVPVPRLVIDDPSEQRRFAEAEARQRSRAERGLE